MSKKGKKQVKYKKNRFLFFLLVLFFVILIVIKLYFTNITNIIVIGNNYYSDQQIIDIAGIKDYPKSISNLGFNIEKKLNKDKYILSSSVRKNIFLNEVTIKIKENYPLFFYNPDSKLVLYNGDKVDVKYDNITVINRIPDKVYTKFLNQMKNVNIEILDRISEIEYKPNDVDNERFLIFMSDGNYVYINIRRFKNINKYIEIIKLFDNKKGILYLDSGEYFDVFDE